MNKSQIDVAVLIIFFNNPQRLQKVFNQCRIARPSTILLFQSGARPGKNDEQGISKCREIISEIDWECKVHTKFIDENYGAAQNEVTAIQWAFSVVDKCIVLEDDDIPAISFFRFCQELLDKYENDHRISMIAGFNHEGITENIDEDYFFTTNCSTWGWASWRRVIDQWDKNYSFLDNPSVRQNFYELIIECGYNKQIYKNILKDYQNKRINIDSVLVSSVMINSGLSIVPRKNMINNIGCDGGGDNYTTGWFKMPKAERFLFNKEVYELDPIIKHPLYVFENRSYRSRVYQIMAWNHPLIRLKRKIESFILKLKYGDFIGIETAIKKRLR